MRYKYFIILLFIISCEVQESSNIYRTPGNDERIDTRLQLKNFSKEELEISKNNYFETG